MRPGRTSFRRVSALLIFICLISLCAALSSYASQPTLPLGEPQWMSVLFRGAKIGYHTSTLLPTDQGFQLTERTFLRFMLLNRPQTVLIQSRILTDEELALRSFSFTMDADPSHYEIQGEVAPGGIKIVTTTLHGASESFLPCAGKIYMNEILPALVAKGRPAPGQELSISALDPLTRALDTIKITVNGRETLKTETFDGPVNKIEITYPTYGLTLWMDDGGAIRRELSPPLTELISASPEKARSGLSERDPMVDLARITQPRLIGRMDDPRSLRSLTALLRGVDASSYDLNGGRQTARGNTVRIDLEDIDETASYTIPYEGEEFSSFLRPDPFIQSRDETIQRQALRIIGDERDALEVVRLVTAWVYENLKKEPVLSVPNALEVLKLRRGDCNEHAILTAALLRAVGVPTRVSTGVVFSDGGFFYHSWNEAFVGAWISIDSTTNRIPADVSHIRLIEGGLERQSRLMNVIGALRIEIISSD